MNNKPKGYRIEELLMSDEICAPEKATCYLVTVGIEPPELDSVDDERTAFHFEPEEWEACQASLAAGKPYPIPADYGFAIPSNS